MRPRMLLALATVLIAGLVTASAQADLPFAKAETVGMSSKRLERINAFIKDYIDTNQIAGAVTLVARKGKIVHFEAQGWRDKEDNQPMEKDAIFSLASMTKPIVSTALMMLWEDGKFMLDDPIAKWLPSYANKQVLDPLTGRRVPARPVTVRHILTHTSGLSLTPRGRAATPLTDGPPLTAKRARSAARRRRPARRGAAEDAARSGRARRRLAARVSAGRTVAVRIVDRLRRDPRREDVRHDDRRVRPHADLPAARHARHLLQRPAREGEQGGGDLPARQGRQDHAAAQARVSTSRRRTFPGVAGLNGTAADYFRFTQMLLNGGEYNGQRLLGRMTVNAMITNQIGSGKPVYIRGDGYGFGLGFAVLTDPVEVAGRAVDRHPSRGAAPTARCSGSIRRRISSAS